MSGGGLRVGGAGSVTKGLQDTFMLSNELSASNRQRFVIFITSVMYILFPSVSLF